MLKDVAIQVAGMMLNLESTEKCVAALRDTLPKVNLISTSCNSGGKKNVAWNSLGSFDNISCDLCRRRIARKVAGKFVL